MESVRVAMARSENCGEITESHLIEQARRGNGDAFAEIYCRYARRVFHYVLTYTETVDDAADLTQHVFLRVFEALPRYRQQGAPFSAWLFRIARNAAIDTYRRRHKTLPWEHIPISWQPLTDDDPEALVLRVEALNRLRLLVAQLGPEKQEMLYLRFAGELTAGEIGAVIGKSKAAVQRQMTRTMQQLKERYHEEI